MLPLRSKQGDLFLTILSLTFGVIDWFYLYYNGSSIWFDELSNLIMAYWPFSFPLIGLYLFDPLNTFIAAPLIIIVLVFKGIEKMWDEGDE